MHTNPSQAPELTLDQRIAAFRRSQPPEHLQRYEALQGRLTSGLSGDKLRLMDGEVLISAVSYADASPTFSVPYYGEGKRLLTTADDFATARLWARTDRVAAGDHGRARGPHWRVHAYHFEGMALVRESEELGAGATAPESCFEPESDAPSDPGSCLLDFLPK